jgi:redox-sensitive bicupin YhaK (pirin superfamily)
VNDPVLQVFPLAGPPWPTVDPFLFCVHHHDAYPAGNGAFGPDAALLLGRNIGSDFGAADGWNMYHGDTVPGFPQHPHRGFETVTFVRRGLIDHADSLGAAARYGEGDVQWLTAGGGIVHAEMFPLLRDDEPNPMELFQIWVNLPAADKMVEPHFTMLWDEDVPRVREDGVEVTVAAGAIDDAVPPSPPPHSWASRPDGDVAIWNIRLDAGASWTLPVVHDDETVRVLYVYEGSSLSIGGQVVVRGNGAVVRGDLPVMVTGGDGPVQVLVLQGRPIGEPVAQYGPFVMNDRAGIEQAFADYQRTQFGGWPWPADDPVHGREGRFARRPDGSLELPSAAHAR